MPQTFTRQQLYNLVWAEPMRTLAARYNISDVGLAKACKKIDIPLPPRGYSAKRQAGKKAAIIPLPPRGLGLPDEIGIGRDRSYGSLSKQEALTMALPSPPVFDDDMEAVINRVKQMAGNVRIMKSMATKHHLIKNLLDEDEVRRQEQIASGYSGGGPIFATRFELRRLKLINSIFCAVAQLGMSASYHGREARGLYIKVGAQGVSFTLDSAKAGKQLEREGYGYGFTARGEHDRMRLVANDKTWQDTEADKIEKNLREIIEEIVIAGEAQHRWAKQNRYNWLVERKADAEREEREHLEKEERGRRERKERLEKQRVDHLLGQATAFKQAKEIRAYVALVRETNASSVTPASESDFESWARWALEQADRIDPVKSGRLWIEINGQQWHPLRNEQDQF